MKRALALCLGLILCICNVSAETAGTILTEFENFTLRTAAAPEYKGDKADGQPLFMYYPAAEGNVTLAAVNAVWPQSTQAVTPEAFRALCLEAEGAVRTQYEAGGFELAGYAVGEPAEKTLWELLVRINETETNLSQRIICVTGAFGTYLFSLSAWSPELLDETTDMLAEALQWK